MVFSGAHEYGASRPGCAVAGSGAGVGAGAGAVRVRYYRSTCYFTLSVLLAVVKTIARSSHTINWLSVCLSEFPSVVLLAGRV